MPFDAQRVENNAGSIEQHLTDFAAGVSSVDNWMMVPEQRGAASVIVTIEYSP